jgi:2-polyprenyl-3-methyl-5-hydroxy-6-metoxy-1,4-benzoquinol methylase
MASFEESIRYSCEESGDDTVQEDVSLYYGKILTKTEDLKTNACCTSVDSIHLPDSLKKALRNISEEVSSKYYGCGLVFPESIEGLSILDLGCGAGRDCFVLSQLVGPAGDRGMSMCVLNIIL